MVSPWLIALFGQAGSQTSQLTHNSLIFSDIRMYCRVEAPVPVEPAPAMASLLAGFHEHVFDRSEEHTSELQSLMRISYAVFCLKNKMISKQVHTAVVH